MSRWWLRSLQAGLGGALAVLFAGAAPAPYLKPLAALPAALAAELESAAAPGGPARSACLRLGRVAAVVLAYMAVYALVAALLGRIRSDPGPPRASPLGMLVFLGLYLGPFFAAALVRSLLGREGAYVRRALLGGLAGGATMLLGGVAVILASPWLSVLAWRAIALGGEALALTLALAVASGPRFGRADPTPAAPAPAAPS